MLPLAINWSLLLNMQKTLPQVEILSQPQERVKGEVLWFVMRNGELMVRYLQQRPWLPSHHEASAYGLDAYEHLYMGRLEGRHCFAVPVDADYMPPTGYEMISLRGLLTQLDLQVGAMAGRASQLVSWHKNHQFCSRCGAKANPHASDSAMVCRVCEYTQYPRISPCIITLVTRGEEALLARNAKFPEGFFSCLAGFIEAGESAEQAVHREVYEEVKIRLGKLRYYSSQSWPFPHALMLGFHSEYMGGEICEDKKEIVEADWFHYQALPQVPRPGSIARELIEAWVQDCKAGRYKNNKG